MKRIMVVALACALGSIALLPAPMASAAPTLNCAGKGKVTAVATFPQLLGVKIRVNKSGPRPQPSWSASYPAATSGADETFTHAYVSPYTEASWTGTTQVGTAIGQSTQCSQQSGPSGTVRKTLNLGNKSCAGQVYFEAGTFGDAWMSWKSTSTATKRNYVRMNDAFSYLLLSSTYTREDAIFDAKVQFYRGSLPSDPDGWGDVSLRCT